MHVFITVPCKINLSYNSKSIKTNLYRSISKQLVIKSFGRMTEFVSNYFLNQIST